MHVIFVVVWGLELGWFVLYVGIMAQFEMVFPGFFWYIRVFIARTRTRGSAAGRPAAGIFEFCLAEFNSASCCLPVRKEELALSVPAHYCLLL